VVEIVRGVARHAQSFHHRAGADVGRHRERDDLVQRERGEAEVESRTRGLGGVALAPMVERGPPADFDVEVEKKRLADA